MLEKQEWLKYAKDIVCEWEQCRDEGRQVDDMKELCIGIREMAQKEDCDALARAVAKHMQSRPVDSSYPYEEPNGLEEIKQACPHRRHTFTNRLTEEELRDKLTGAWTGRISGCLLGKPVEGRRRADLYRMMKETNNYPLHRYIDASEFSEELIKDLEVDTDWCWINNIHGTAPVDDDTNYTVFALKLVEEYGLDFVSNDVLEAWMTWIPILSTCTAERVAYRNASMGLRAPDTATYQNPFRELIGAQIRGDFFGYIMPGEPGRAAELAWRDASISHVKNGIYGEMFVSAMIAAAAVCDDIITVIEAGLDVIPARSRLHRDVEAVLSWRKSGMDAEQIIEKIHQTYDEKSSHDWGHTNSNAMIVTMALLCGNGDFGKSVCLAVQAAFDTDCNGATVGSIIGIMTGGKHIDPCWTEPYQGRLSTTILGYWDVTIPMLVERTMNVISKKRENQN